MKKASVVIGMLFLSFTLLTSCGEKAAKKEVEIEVEVEKPAMKMEATAVVYHCPMHPEVTGVEGDECEKCGGMKLVAKTDAKMMCMKKGCKKEGCDGNHKCMKEGCDKADCDGNHTEKEEKEDDHSEHSHS